MSNSRGNQQNSPNKNTGNVSPELVLSILEQNKQKMELEARSISLQEREIETAASQAEKAMELQAEDLKDMRRFEFKKSLVNTGLWFACVLCIVGLTGYCVYSGNKDIADTITKSVLPAVVTGIGGYYAGKSQTSSKHKAN